MRAAGRLLIALTPLVLPGQRGLAQAQRPLMFSARQCDENAIHLLLDPRPIQDVVGPGFTLVLEEGKARVAIIVHDCSQYWIDGRDAGPARDIRVWVAVRGLDDVRPVVGAEQTPPTRTWFTLLEGSSNPRVREAKAAAGVAEAVVDSVFLAAAGSRQGGRAYLGGNLAFSWHVPSLAPPSVRLLGLNFDVYRRDSAGHVTLNRIQALMHVTADPSPGTLEVVRATGVEPLIGPGTYPVTVRLFFPMWSRATQGLPPP